MHEFCGNGEENHCGSKVAVTQQKPFGQVSKDEQGFPDINMGWRKGEGTSEQREQQVKMPSDEAIYFHFKDDKGK